MPVIQLEIRVGDVQQIVVLYDRIQLFRSPDEFGSPTPFSQITSIEATRATIDGTVEGPWNLNGQSINIIVDAAESVTVSFSGTNPFLPATVRGIINAAFSALPSQLAVEVPTDTDKLRLISSVSGTQSVLQVSGAGAATLGLSTARANGKMASPLLSSNTEIYVLTDFDGQPTYWYKARYLNSETGAISEFSTSFLGLSGARLPDSLLSLGKIALADSAGNPLKGRRIIFVPVSPQVIASSGSNYGILPSVDRIVVTTDDDGRISVSLIKGQRLKVFIEGTTFQREFVVPDTAFDILTVASVQPDPLNIVISPPIPIRVS